MMNIELVKPEWVVGDEKRFYDFIGDIDDKDKVAIISHNDLDGVVAAKLANEVLDADLIILLGYTDLNEKLVKELKEKKIKKVIFTDLNFSNPDILFSISNFSRILYIDHHKITNDFNSNNIIFMNAQGFCAGYLCYYLFSKIQDLSKMDWLVCCSCISDYMYFKNQEWIKKIFDKYEDKFMIIGENLRNEGIFWNLQAGLSLALTYFKDNPKKVYNSIGNEFGNIGDLKKYSDIIQKELDNLLKRYDKEKEIINGVSFWEVNSKYSVKDILVNILSHKNRDKTLIFIQNDRGVYKISARRQDKTVDLPNLLGELLNGFENSSSGGHIPAAGGGFPEKYLDEFKRRLKEIPEQKVKEKP